MSEKRYQVFISSTFRDLLEERQAVLKAVLELDHMPAGMELFPAADDSAWQLIKDVIDSSDYYVLLIGGRYGSLDETGLSYTEKEYDYASHSKKPVIALLHKNPDNLPRDKTETDPTAWERLKAFRTKVERKHTCVYWESAEELKAKVIVGLTANTKRHPAIGWMRADAVPSDATVRDVLSLRKRLAELESELDHVRTNAPPGTEDLMQGDDTIKIKYSFRARPIGGSYSDYREYIGTLSPTWNEIFAGVSPAMISEAPEHRVRRAFQEHLQSLVVDDLAEHPKLKKQVFDSINFKDSDVDTCLIQLRALGLICESNRKRSVTDKATYWMLTPYGDRLMVQLRALRHTAPAKRILGEMTEAAVEKDQGAKEENSETTA